MLAAATAGLITGLLIGRAGTSATGRYTGKKGKPPREEMSVAPGTAVKHKTGAGRRKKEAATRTRKKVQIRHPEPGQSK